MIGINADYRFRTPSFYNHATGAYENSATVTATLKDFLTGEVILADIECDYVADSNGQYEGLIPDTTTADLTQDQELLLCVLVVSDTNQYYSEDREIAGFKNLL